MTDFTPDQGVNAMVLRQKYGIMLGIEAAVTH